MTSIFWGMNRALRMWLIGHFPASVVPNGNYGPATRAAVTAYQAANGLPTLGIVGPRTRAALNAFHR
jgi:peptidoglycan hydrolase-like protein with peptidoglycan-binding domain